MLRFCFSLVCVIIFGTSIAADTNYDRAPFFVLKQSEGGYKIDEIYVESGQTRVINPAEYPGFIDIILPVGPGGSGSISKSGSIKSIKLSFDGQTLKSEYEKSGSGVYQSPARKLDDLKKYDTHISVTGADGSAATFILRKYADVIIKDTGPIMEMFRGMIPLNEGDYSLFLNTTTNQRYFDITGEIPVYYSGKYLFTEVLAPDGRKGLFAIDIGAAMSLVTESFLPSDLDVSETYMMEYSSGQQRKLKYSPGGATGPVETIIGHATISYFDIGNLHYPDVTVDVIKELPDLHGRKIDGIIGLDILKSAQYMKLIYDTVDSTGSRIILSNSPESSGNAIELPYVCIRQLMYIKGQINNRDCYFILDSGSPDCMLAASSADALGISFPKKDTLQYKGGGGQLANGWLTEIDSLVINGQLFGKVPFVVGDLSVMALLGKDQYGGLLGNSFFKTLKSVTLDFDLNKVRFEY